MRILYADDMWVNQQVVKRMLEPKGVTVDLAEHGIAAVEMAARARYDVIILDRMMPMMDGLEAADLIRASLNTPIYMVTGDEELSQEDISYPVLQKPITEEMLMRVLGGVSTVEGGTRTVSDKVRRIYLEEMEELLEVLPGLRTNDPALFITKVHGIKSASRQVGETGVANLAEVIELAGKKEDWESVDIHLSTLLEKMKSRIV